MLASLVEAIADAFNWRLEHGIRRDNSIADKTGARIFDSFREEVPSWTSKVGAVAIPLALLEAGSDGSAVTVEQHFLQRNITVPSGYSYTV